LTIQRKRVAKRLASGLLAGALALGGLAISGGSASAKTPSAKTTERLSGDDRYETAVEVARNYDETNVGKNGLVVASGESPYDALAAAALAGQIDAPIVLVRKDSLPESVADFLSDYKANFQAAVAKKVYVIGGEGAISEDVVTAMKNIVHAGDPITPIGFTRIGGADRYETAKLISEVPGLTDAADTMIIVNGTDGKWADALSAASLAAENKWPIILTGNGALNASAKAAVDAFLALPGSNGQFLLVGGPAVLSTDIDEYLDSEGVLPRDIFRRGGVDRYQTNFLVSLYTLAAAAGGEGGTSTFLGTPLALASGVSPWDALAAGPWAAKNDAHLILTPTSAPSPFATGLVTSLTAGGFPNAIWVIGGKNAVAESVRTSLVATAASTDTTSSLANCVAGQTTVYLNFASKISAAEGETVTASSNAYFTLNGVKDSATSFISSISNFGTTGNNSTPLNNSFAVALSAKLAVGDVVKFAGVAEGTSAAHPRTLGPAECTAVADTTAPTASIKPVITSAGAFDHVIVTLSEPMTTKTGAADTAGVSLTANAYWKVGSTQVFPTQIVTLSATALNTTYTSFKVSLDANSSASDVNAALANLATLTLEKEAIVDVGGNTQLVNSTGTILKDTGKSTFSLGSVVCSAKSAAIFTRGDLKITAKSAAVGGALNGRAANDYRLTVVNKRGILTPSVVVDSSAKTITVTMDTSYHNALDVKTAAGNQVQTGNFAFAGDADGDGTEEAVSATTVALPPSTNGVDSCKMDITYSEPSYMNDAALTVGGVSTTVTGVNSNPTLNTSKRVTFEAEAAGAASAVLAGTTHDAQGTPVTNATTASVTLP